MEALLTKEPTGILVVARTDGSRRGRSKLVRASGGGRGAKRAVNNKNA